MYLNRRCLMLVAVTALIFLSLGGCGGGGDGSTTQTARETNQPEESVKTGAVEYTANFPGEQPERTRNDATGNPECGVDTVLGQEVVVNDNQTLRDVVLSVKSGPPGYEVPASDVVIDQKNCRYQPHVTTVKAGQTVKITDSDPKMHNVRATQDGRQLFNLSTFKGDEKEVSFEDPGLVKLECNIHPWMEAWVYVTEHGKATVTREDGKATLEELPTGEYTLEAWHEEFGSNEHSPSVKENQTVTIEDTFE